LSLHVEKIEKSQKFHNLIPSSLLHKLCAQSSIINIFFNLANLTISFILAAFQKVCCTIITLVFFVILFFNSFISNHKLFFSISEYFILAQVCITAFDTDTHVYHETITSSFLLIQISLSV